MDLRDQFHGWLVRRRKADVLKRHGQQFSAVEAVVEASLCAIGESLAPLSALPKGEVYAKCRQADHQITFVRRLWEFFRERWDQRDDPSLAPLLAAADELVWSCHQPAVRRLRRQAEPAPLPHITPEFSAHTIGRHLRPPGLRESDKLLARTVQTLPVSLIGLPYSCVSGPWWLVLVAHEVGHQVAYAIDDLAGAPRIADLVTGAAKEAGATLEMQRRWRAWSHEVFADAYAAATVGAAHLWVLVELEQGDDESMVRNRTGYPPPIVRQEFVARLIERMGLTAEDAVPPPPPSLDPAGLAVTPEAREQIMLMMEIVPSMAATLATADLMPGADLSALSDWSASSLGRREGAGWWLTQFRQGQATPEEGLESARLAAVGALAAWSEIVEEPEAATRREHAEALSKQILQTLPASREEAVRDMEDEGLLGFGPVARQIASEVLALPAEDPVGELEWV